MDNKKNNYNKPVIRTRFETTPVPCPCGSASRIITAADSSPVSFHVVEIKKDSEMHYHDYHTEIYYVLKGRGKICLDENEYKISEGSAVLIPPGVRHRAVGRMEIINVVYPPFDPEDEHIV